MRAGFDEPSTRDPDIKARYAKIPSPMGHGEGRYYLVTPAKLEGTAPAVLVVHENRGQSKVQE